MLNDVIAQKAANFMWRHHKTSCGYYVWLSLADDFRLLTNTHVVVGLHWFRQKDKALYAELVGAVLSNSVPVVAADFFPREWTNPLSRSNRMFGQRGYISSFGKMVRDDNGR